GASDGTFINYMVPGSYTADVFAPSGRLGAFNFDIVAGQTTDVDFGTTPTGTNVAVQLSGGLATPGGLGLTFSSVSSGGSTAVVESGSGPPPPTGYSIVGLGGQDRYWDIDTTATHTGPITVCVHYDITQVEGPETQIRLMHDAGAGFVDITTSLDTDQDIVCGQTTSLSPFAVVESLHPLSLPGVVTASTGWSLRGAVPPTTGTLFNLTLGTKPLVPLVGDWNGDGKKTPGTYEAGTFKLFNGFTATAATYPLAPIKFGDSRGFPVAGDFDGDGRDDLAVFRNGLWQVRFSDDGATTTFNLGPATGTWPGVVPVAGDWDGDGIDGIGMYVAGTWTLRNVGAVAGHDTSFVYNPGDKPYPVVGDWDADGDDTVGVKSSTSGSWRVKNSNVAGNTPDNTFTFGAANDLAMVWQLGPDDHLP
ncbi:MAG: hypothetical protein QOH36_84, partial [Actinomycetota bacterium]|nr:hypothetical protein [Actinomycetota bacterium]